MILTTKGRYAVMALVDIALQKRFNGGEDRAVKLSEISQRQDISISYLEQIFLKLKSEGLVKSVRGPGGGYKLTDNPENIKVSAVIDAVREDIKVVRCDHDPNKGCMSSKARCITHDLWEGLGMTIENYLGKISLQDVLDKKDFYSLAS